MSRYVIVYLRNSDPYSNEVKAWDENQSNKLVFSGVISANNDDGEPVTVLENDSGFAKVITSTDGNPSVKHQFLHDGDKIDI